MIFEIMSDGFQIKVKKHSRSYGSRLRLSRTEQPCDKCQNQQLEDTQTTLNLVVYSASILK